MYIPPTCAKFLCFQLFRFTLKIITIFKIRNKSSVISLIVTQTNARVFSSTSNTKEWVGHAHLDKSDVETHTQKIYKCLQHLFLTIIFLKCLFRQTRGGIWQICRNSVPQPRPRQAQVSHNLFLHHIFKLPNSLFFCCYDDKIAFQQGVCWGEARWLSHWRRM